MYGKISTEPFVKLDPEQLDQLATLISDKMKKDLLPAKDRISQREAYRIYGQTWVKRMTELHPAIRKRTGRTWEYSRERLNMLSYTREGGSSFESKLVFKKQRTKKEDHEAERV